MSLNYCGSLARAVFARLESFLKGHTQTFFFQHGRAYVSLPLYRAKKMTVPIFPNSHQGSNVCNQNMFLNMFCSAIGYSGFGSKFSKYCPWSSDCRRALWTAVLAVVSGHRQYLENWFSTSGLEVSAFSLRNVTGHVGELSSRGCFRYSHF